MKIDTSSYYPKSPLDDDIDPVISGGEENTVPDDDSVIIDDEPEVYPDLPPTQAEEVVTQVSHFLSWVLVPLLMSVYGLLLAFGLSILAFTDFSVRLTFTAIVTAINVAVPALLILLLKRIGLVKDVGLNHRSERFVPYIVCIVCLVATGLFLHFKGAPTWLVMFYFGGAAAGVVEVVVNQWWKISVHAAGMAGIVALLLRMQLCGEYMSPAIGVWMIVAIALTGLLGSARIWLHRHTLAQVLAGYAVGFCSVFFMMSV